MFQNLRVKVEVALLSECVRGCLFAMKSMSEMLMKPCSHPSLSYFSATHGFSMVFAFTWKCMISQLLCAPMS